METSKGLTAYSYPIEEGKVRIIINVGSLRIKISDSSGNLVEETPNESLSLKLNFANIGIDKPSILRKELTTGSGEKKGQLVLEENTVWFDLDIDSVSALLNKDILFSIESDSDSYSYFLEALEYHIEWLQNDNLNKKVFRVSVTNRTFKQSFNNQNLSFNLDEVERAAGLLGRSIKKIDLRVGSSYVKLKTDNGKLDPLLSSIASQLGYSIQPLNEEVRKELASKGKKATHKISLLMNY